MKVNPLISVIIPVYNVEKYLRKCLDSIINQTYTNLEILLVDDGSTDSSGDICDEYAEKDSRIKVFHKENGGLSDARNTGLDNAKGEYISFVDSDDFIHPQFVEILFHGITLGNVDICFCNFLEFKNLEEIKIDNITSNIKNKFKSEEFIDTLYNNSWYPKNVVVWNKIYNRNIFKKIRFIKGVIHEDEAIFIEIYKQKNLTIAYVDNNLYFYRDTPTSITKQRINANKINSLFRIYKERTKFFPLGTLNYNESKARLIKVALTDRNLLSPTEIKKILPEISFFILREKNIHWKIKILFLVYKLFGFKIKSNKK